MLKKLLVILLLALPTFAQDITGSGTSGDPYILYNAADVDSIRILGLSNFYYELGADIDLSTIDPWTPLVVPQTPSSSTFSLDGNGYTIKNMHVTSNSSTRGAAGFVDNYWNRTILKNLVFDSCDVDIPGVGYTYGTAIILSQASSSFASGILYNITLQNSSISVTTNGARLAGIVGNAAYNFQITDCLVQNCTFTKTITGTDVYGTMAGVCAAPASGASPVFERNGSYNNTFNWSSTSYFNGNGVAGIAGSQTGDIVDMANCFSVGNTFNIDGTDTHLYGYSSVGGLISYEDNVNFTMTDCYAADNTINMVNFDYYSGLLLGSLYYRSGYTVTLDSCYWEASAGFSSWHLGLTGGTLVDNSSEHTVSEMHDPATFIGFDFGTVWDTSSSIMGGYPYLIPVNTITLTSPSTGETYNISDSVTVAWSGPQTYCQLWLSDDNGATFVLEDSAIANGEKYALADSIMGSTIKMRIVGPSNEMSTSGAFNVLGHLIEILSPVDSTATLALGDTVDISVRVVLVDTLSLWYTTDDTTGGAATWWPITQSTPLGAATIDTINYKWVFPNIHGTVYIKASEYADTSVYTFDVNSWLLGRQLNSSAGTICWSHIGGDMIVNYNCLDLACGWTSYSKHQWTTLLNDDATGYTFVYGDGTTTSCDISHFYTPDSVTIFDPTTNDTTVMSLDQFYTNEGTSVTYKGRTYYIDDVNKYLLMNDDVNGIDSIFVSDLSPYCDRFTGGYYWGWIDVPTNLQIYNVQWSKISGDTLSSATVFETLNDADFSPVLIISGSSYGSGGDYIRAINALGYPATLSPAEDIVRVFTSLTTTRNYFRGIDPKAHKTIR